MRMTNADETPEAIIVGLAPYSMVLHDCLRHAVDDARDQFPLEDGVRSTFEPWLFAHHVRWAFKRRLQAQLPPGTPITVDGDTIMSSVIVRLDDVVLRFRKSEPGEVPPPGSSTKMQMWYAQTLDGAVERHLLALWHVDDALRYTGLDIAFPSGGTAYTTITRWMVPLIEAIGAPDDLAIALRERDAAATSDSETGDTGP